MDLDKCTSGNFKSIKFVYILENRKLNLGDGKKKANKFKIK